jgi:hypothetical protein
MDDRIEDRVREITSWLLLGQTDRPLGDTSLGSEFSRWLIEDNANPSAAIALLVKAGWTTHAEGRSWTHGLFRDFAVDYVNDEFAQGDVK